MERSEWDLIKDVDRKLRYIVQKCSKIDKHDKEIEELRLDIENMQEVFVEFEKILVIKRKIRRAVIWIVTLTLTAALTTYINYYVNQALLQRDKEVQVEKAPDNSRS